MKTKTTCTICGGPSETYGDPSQWHVGRCCHEKIFTDDYTKSCKFPVPYTWCRRMDMNADGYCPEHAEERCKVCGKQATQACSTGSFGICGTPTCSDECHEKHRLNDHPDGRLA